MYVHARVHLLFPSYTIQLSISTKTFIRIAHTVFTFPHSQANQSQTKKFKSHILLECYNEILRFAGARWSMTQLPQCFPRRCSIIGRRVPRASSAGCECEWCSFLRLRLRRADVRSSHRCSILAPNAGVRNGSLNFKWNLDSFCLEWLPLLRIMGAWFLFS